MQIDPQRSCAVVNGRVVPLRPLDLRVLVILARRPHRAISRGAIAEELWGSDTTVDPRAVDACIARLRRALNGAGEAIVTVRRVGYRLDVSRVDGADG
jgi:DNA-binding response OmpR family regulator